MTNETTAPDLIERLRLYERCWGDEPSIAPHVENSPGITTGRVIMDANEAADALEAAQARIAELEVDRDKPATEQPSVKEAARVLLEYLPNYAMENAALESRARDDEGEFASLSDLLDFSGQNKAYTVVREALTAALRSLAGDE